MREWRSKQEGFVQCKCASVGARSTLLCACGVYLIHVYMAMLMLSNEIFLIDLLFLSLIIDSLIVLFHRFFPSAFLPEPMRQTAVSMLILHAIMAIALA